MGCFGLTDSSELKKMLKGRTPEQQKAIRYLNGGSGCLKKKLPDEEYESMIMEKAKSMDFKKKALDKIGLDESQVNEVAPIHFEDYVFDTNIASKRGKDSLWRSAKYQISWIFFSSTQVYVYQHTFSMDKDEKKEETEEYFYKDITNFTTTSDTVETEETKYNCMGKETRIRTNIDANRFTLASSGGKLYCAMKQNDYTEKAIQGMKAKLREKKG
jgi:hypothetical protein